MLFGLTAESNWSVYARLQLNRTGMGLLLGNGDVDGLVDIVAQDIFRHNKVGMGNMAPIALVSLDILW
jgi:hypothetical protein